ncbi:Ectopic P granules protein 5 [Blomia tropicalis]|nr:Ectopic P granules protein 5 [Blomia tropicalis]
MLQFVGEQREGNLWIDLCQTVFESIHFDDFIPDGKFFYIVYGWLNDLHPSNILNRLARIVLSKLDWNRILIQTDQCLLFSEEVQRRHALKLYHSLMNQLKIQTENQESIKNPIKMSIKSINRDSIGISNMLRLAKSTQLIDYISWTWSNLLILRIHPLDLIPNECSWDEIIFGTHNIDTLRIIKKVNYKHRIFQQLPRINFDNEVVSIAKALELHGDESDPFAGYIALMMTDLINKHNDPGKYLEICFQTLARPNSVMHHIPLLSLLYHLIPLYVHQWETLCSNQKFIQIILELLQKQYTEELSSIILEHMKHFHYGENAAQMAIVWSEILFETMYLALVQASRGGSWLSSWTGSSLVTTQQHLEMIFEQLTLIFDRLAEQIIVSNCGSNNEEKNLLFIQYIKYLVERPFTKHNNSSSSIVSKLTAIIESPNQSTPTVTPNSSTQTSSSWSLFNFLPWSSGDDTDIYYLVDKNILKSEWCTPFHIMLRQRINRKIAQQQQNFKSSVAKKLQRQPVNEKPIVLPFYLAYLVIESDIRKSGRIWDHLVYTINNFDIAKASVSTDKSELVSVDFELELKNVCKTLEKPTIPYSLLPINSLIVWLLNSTPPSLDLSSPKELLTSPHPMIPLLWKNFFQLYFSHSGIGSSSIGLQFIGSIFLERMQHRLTLLFDHHNRLWLQLNNQKAVNLSESSNQPKQSDLISSLLFEDRLLKLYRAYRLWLTDPRLHSSFVNLDDDSDYCQPEFQSNILKFIFSSTSSSNQSSSSRTESPISGKSMSLTSSEQFTTNFFFLNYINKAMLSSEITKFEDFWYNCIKGNKYNCIKREKTSNEAKKTKPINQSSKRPNTLQLSNNKIKTLDEIKKKIGQYKPIIEYFTSLTSTLNVNLLFDDNPYCLDDLSAQQSSLIAHDPSVIIVIIHQLIDTITEEARFVENQLKKYSELNHEFCNDILPKLYQNIRKELNKKISCDREEFDAAGCAKSAIIHFEFIESILDLQAKQRYERNRSDLALILRTLTKEIPVQKVVGSVYFLKKVLNYQLRYFDGDPNNEWNKTQIRTLLQSMTGWISLLNSVQSAKYFVTGQVLDQLLDMLSQLSPRYDDPINYFLLETSLQRNMNLTMIQQLAPCLSPAKCVDPKTFISMYKLIGDNLANTSQQTVFVLLSKFDVGSWLRSANVNDDQRSEFLNCLYQCLYLFGVTPTDEYLVTFDLYRKHLQDIILYQFPLFMQNILQFMLNGMNEAQLAPTLWSSLLHTFGFYTKSLSFTNHINRTPATTPAIRQQSSTLLDFDYVTFDLDLRGYTVRQTIFTSHELFELIQIMLEFQQFINQESTSEFLDYFKTYASKYLQFISFISYCWIGTNSTPSTCPDDLSIVWNPFIKLWNDWIIPKRSTKFISFEHLNFAWSLFVSSIQFMIDSFSQQRVTYFLSNLWQNFLHFIVETKTETLDEKDVEMFQEHIELMYEAVIQNRFNVERFIAFIISRINWRQTLSNLDRRFTNEQLSHIVDNLSCVLIALSNQPYIVEIDLESIPFIVLSPQKVKEITLMLLPMMKQKMQNNKQFTVQLGSSFFNLKRNDSDTEVDEGILLSLLRTVCDVQKNRGLSNQQFSPIHFPKQAVDENWYIMKNLYFTNCIASLVSYYLNSNAEPKSEEVRIVLQFWVEKMNNTLAQLDSNNRILMFESILGSINQVVDESNRKRLSTIFVTVLSYSLPSCIEQLADLIQSINRCVQSISIVVYLLECFIETYLDLNGSSTSPPTTPSNEEPTTSSLITESIRTQSSGSYGDPVLLKLAMSPNQFGPIVNISTIFETDEGKNYFLSNSNLYRSILTLQTLSKTIHEVITESLNRGWFFFRSTKQSSNWCLFLMECLTLHGISTLLELYYPETIISTYENMFQQQQQTTLANGTKLSDRLIRSSSNDSLTSSGGSPSRSTTEYNSPNSSTSNSNSLLYSESIRIKLRTEFIEQFRQSYNRLMKQWKRDKSFQDIWIHIDEINNLFSEQLDRLGKQMDSIHRTWHLQTTSGVDDSELETLSNDERIPVSNNVTEQQQQQQSNMIREQFTKLQRKRFNLIQSWISTFYSDKNYINAFL